MQRLRASWLQGYQTELLAQDKDVLATASGPETVTENVYSHCGHSGLDIHKEGCKRGNDNVHCENVVRSCVNDATW